MITTSTLTMYEHEQPASAWAGIDDVLGDVAPGLPVDRSLEFGRSIALEDAAEAEALAARLRDAGLVVEVARDTVLEDSDYEMAEYVGIYGTDPGRKLVRNEKRALAPTGPCPTCGGQDALDVRQVEPFEVKESVPPGALEVVALPGGGIAVSARLAGLLGELSGVRLTPLSPGLVQVTAERVVLVPCRTHTTVRGEPHCPDCGRARGDVEGYFWVSDAQVAGSDLVARNRNGMSFLFASRRMLDLLAGAEGLTTYDVMRLCQHDDLQ